MKCCFLLFLLPFLLGSILPRSSLQPDKQAWLTFILNIFMLISVVGRLMVPQTCPYPSPRNLWLWHVTWQRGIRGADGMKVGNQLIWSKSDSPGLSRQPSGSRRQNRVRLMQSEKDLTSHSWLWRRRKGPTAKDCRQSLGAGKRQGEGFSPQVSSKECSPADILPLTQWDSLKTSPQNCKIIHLGCFHPPIS